MHKIPISAMGTIKYIKFSRETFLENGKTINFVKEFIYN